MTGIAGQAKRPTIPTGGGRGGTVSDQRAGRKNHDDELQNQRASGGAAPHMPPATALGAT